MHTFFASGAQPLFDSLLLLPQEGALAGPTGRPPNSYAFFSESQTVLFDAPYRWVLPALRRLRESGRPPTALVLSHRHVAAQGDAFAVIRDEFDVPFYLHPDDARHPEAQRAGVVFEDPGTSELLAEAGLDVWSAPYHTQGSIMLHSAKHGGLVLAGDSAVAPGPKQDVHPPRLERPPTISPEADDALQDFWRSLDRPLRSILPLHGVPYTDRDDLDAIMRPLIEGKPMVNR